MLASLAEDADLSDEGRGPSVQRQSLVLFRRPATGVWGQESLSSSDDDESRLSPMRGPLRRGELWSDDRAGFGFSSDSCRGDMLALDEAGWAVSEWCEAEMCESVDASEAVDELVDMVEMVDTDDSRSEWAMVYFVVVISSSSGVRKQTCFSAGNMGRLAAILRGIIERAGLFARIEVRLCGCL